MSGKRKTIAIGPEIDRPTWSWVGFDLARELAKYFDVKVFRRHRINPCDGLIAIKEPLPLHVLDSINAPCIIYLPCDRYRSTEEIAHDLFLKRCSSVVCHSRRLLHILTSFHSHVSFLMHSGKYILPNMNPYREKGFVLWIGFSLYIPYLRQWLLEHPLEAPLTILTDWPGEESVPGDTTQYKWTPRLQFEMMSLAKAAIDIKGSNFNQRNRPPEKLQTFIASGIPPACNPGPIMTDLHESGFNISSPEDTGRWFSREYYNETIDFGRGLRNHMSLTQVGLEIKKVLDQHL